MNRLGPSAELAFVKLRHNMLLFMTQAESESQNKRKSLLRDLVLKSWFFLLAVLRIRLFKCAYCGDLTKMAPYPDLSDPVRWWQPSFCAGCIDIHSTIYDRRWERMEDEVAADEEKAKRIAAMVPPEDQDQEDNRNWN
jgi:hypothetical protein